MKIQFETHLESKILDKWYQKSTKPNWNGNELRTHAHSSKFDKILNNIK